MKQAIWELISKLKLNKDDSRENHDLFDRAIRYVDTGNPISLDTITDTSENIEEFKICLKKAVRYSLNEMSGVRV